ncbi:MAG: MBL fold metallo-hydrolase [Rhizobiaceae bacterium]|nr:MBL fold metallo-hydrolase [Rhizobiaceae bacterium]
MAWFEKKPVGQGITMIWEPFVRLGIRCNMWHVRGSRFDLLFDSGMGVVPLLKELGDMFRAETLCVASHTHFDHIGGHHEFDRRAVHEAEADILARPTTRLTGIDRYVDESTFLSLPYEGFDWRAYRIEPAPASWLLKEGDEIDIGDRCFVVMHLPGHSPGCISLYERETGILLSGDVVYDGTLYDDLEGSSIRQYRQSLRRLRDLPVSIVHGGHRESFDQARMIAIIDDYLRRTETNDLMQ